MRFSEFFIKICKICLYIVLQNREENCPSLRQVRLLNRTADQSALYVNITCIYTSHVHVVQLNRKMKYLYEARDHIVMNGLTCDTFTHSARLVSCVHMTKMKCKSTVPSMWFIHRHEMTQNVHNFSMCRANAISRMLYVNSVQLRIELTHAYPIEILSQTRRYSRKFQKTESYIISNELYTVFSFLFLWYFISFSFAIYCLNVR